MSVTPASESADRIATDDPELASTLVAFGNLDYRDKFWPSRRYEDQADRMALRALLPGRGQRLVDVGAGFGRLADEYGGYREVVLLDPSDALLASAREHWGGDPRFAFVTGTAEALPLPDASVDAVVCVRVLHHARDPRPAIREFARVLRPGGVLVLEIANKRNLKAVLGWLLRRRRSSPFAPGSEPYVDFTLAPARHVRGRDALAAQRTAGPVERPWSAATWYRHSSADVRSWLGEAGLAVGRTRSVGLLRAAFVTHHVPIALLVALERLLQPGLAALMPGPSIFVAAVRRPEPGQDAGLEDPGAAA